ncbi:MAG: hypothetical protein K5795_06030 [Lachnospiraceae bacterium]|nr:hypothetical protein [Lachnospiraceae bacterium]
MKNMTLPCIAEAVHGKLYIDGQEYTPDINISKASEKRLQTEAEGVVIDSRLCKENYVFAAVKGERTDGHSYIPSVIAKGALGCICEKLPEAYDKKPDPDAEAAYDPVREGAYILVESTLQALKDLAAYYRKQIADVKIFGIVGSVGKTSTKELVAAVLSESFNTLKTDGNFNNEIGVPLTLFRIRPEHEMAVVEMGISDFSEMDRLGAMVKPDAVIMTNIGPCHLEKLGDLDGVLKAKTEVLNHIKPGGLLILNTDDEKLRSLYELKGSMESGSLPDKEPELPAGAKEALKGLRVASYGKTGDVSYLDIESRGVEGSNFHFRIKQGAFGLHEKTIPARVHMQGTHMVMNALAACIAGLEAGMDAFSVTKGIEAARPVKGRCCPNYTDRYLVVDDSYNANPKSMMAAADLMSESEGRKVVVLGDMFELGSEENRLHYDTGSYVAERSIDLAVFIGPLAKNMYEGYMDKKRIIPSRGEKAVYYATKEEFFDNLATCGIREGDTILVKASHGMGFDEIVDKLVEKGTKFRFVKGRESMILDDIMKLLAQTHWACNRSRETVAKSIENSLCFGILDENGVQIAFGRTVTDYATMFYVSDVVIDIDHQKMGLGSRFVEFIKSATELKDLWGFLGTTKASGFYSKFGFEKKDDFFMAMPKTNVKGIFNVTPRK